MQMDGVVKVLSCCVRFLIIFALRDIPRGYYFRASKNVSPSSFILRKGSSDILLEEAKYYLLTSFNLLSQD